MVRAFYHIEVRTCGKGYSMKYYITFTPDRSDQNTVTLVATAFLSGGCGGIAGG